MNPFRVVPFQPSEPSAHSYAVLIAVSGFEERCTYVAEHLSGRWAEGWVYQYQATDAEVALDCEKYWRAYTRTEIDGTRVQLDDMIAATVEVQRAARRVRSGSHSQQAVVRFAVDISSMDRKLMAAIVSAFAEVRECDVVVDFYYAEGAYRTPWPADTSVVVQNGPVESFRGWSSDPSVPLLAIVGAGFEGPLALAAVETLEPSDTLVVFPRGSDKRFDSELETRNYEFLSTIGSGPRHYDVAAPFGLFRNLWSTVASARATNRVVIVPLGPKVFSLAAFLVASLFDDVAVWHVESERMRVPSGRVPAGPIVGLRMVLEGGAHGAGGDSSP